MMRAPAAASRVRSLVATVIFLALLPASGAAGTVTLTWDQNPEPDIAGYVVHYGTAPGQYAASVDVGNQTVFQFSEPDSTARYYFVVCAYNSNGDHSGFSEEVSTDSLSSFVLTGVESNLAAPQPAGTLVAFTARTAGATAPPEFKWLVSDGMTWTTTQTWSASDTFTWSPTVANPKYTVAVWVRPGGSSVDSPDPSLSAYIPFPIGQPLALTALSASLPAPQMAGTSIAFVAEAAGGVAPYQYKWLISDGASWTVAQPWSATNSFTWTPSTGNAKYSVGVWVRSATSTADAPDNANAGTSMPFAINPTPGKIAVTSLTANKPAPQTAGTKVLFTATASGAAAYEFKWWLFDGTTWSIAQEWSASNKLMWNPAVANPSYQVLVRARDAANSSESDGAAMPFPIAPAKGRGGGR